MSDEANGAKGLVGGAASGAAIGTMIAPGIGTAIGGIGGAALGGLYGWLSGDNEENARKQRLLEAYRNGNSEFRREQQALIGDLTSMSQGRGPSAAAAQMQAAMGRNQAGAASMMASGRGTQGGTMQQAMNAQAVSNAQIAEAAMVQRAAEQQRAYELRGMNISQARQMDEQRAQAALAADMGYQPAPSVGDQLLASGLAAGSKGAEIYATQQAGKKA